MLPMILSILGSTAAGALGTMSPLIAGAIGSGVGTAVQTGDIEKGIMAGLGGMAGGAMLGSAMGGAAGTAVDPTGVVAGNTAAAAAKPGIMGTLFQGGAGTSAVANPILAGNTLGEKLGNLGSGAGQVPWQNAMSAGLKAGTFTGAGIGSALTAPLLMPSTQYGGATSGDSSPKREYKPNYPSPRQTYTPPAGYNAGRDGEFLYFDPYPQPSQYTPTVRMSAGGIAGIPLRNPFQYVRPMVEGGPTSPAQPNEKDIVANAIRAVREELPEQQAAIALAQFVQTYGEDALRKLVDDVQSRGTSAGNVEGKLSGPGDGMDDLIPAAMDNGGSDVLLSEGEFVVPADVVSGLGNGSTDAGAAELDNMMRRVREERTGMTEQPKQVRAGGLLPA